MEGRGLIDVRVPGDKSLTHRALILASLAEGESRLTGLLTGEDPQATRNALRTLGVPIGVLPEDGTELRVSGVGLQGLREPTQLIDCCNSGTTARLLLGVLSSQRLVAALTGDESLRRRPMRRVTEPLSRMGAQFRELGVRGCLPIEVRGSVLRPLEHVSTVSSAQVKGALLLAGLTGGVDVSVVEPVLSRDHTERLLRAMGVGIHSEHTDQGWQVRLSEPPSALPPLDFAVPADFSSAAFFLVLGLLLGGDASVRLVEVGLNPTRTGLLSVLSRMGATVEVDRESDDRCGEPVGTLIPHSGRLQGTEVTAAELPALIDEVPALVALAARAEGVTRITGASELRVKESDRIAALATNLRALGVSVEELPDGLEVEGTDRPLQGEVRSFDDHRIAMAFGVLASLPGNRVRIDDRAVADVSFPGFWRLLDGITSKHGNAGGRGSARSAGQPASGLNRKRGPIITIDGPAGSGKSTTARVVAQRLGFRHLDSGALYRALTCALLEAGIPPDRWPALDRADLDRFAIRLEPRAGNFAVLLGQSVLDAELRTSEVTEHVSQLSGLPAVRSWLLERQRAAGASGQLVAEGRDMGTVVFPDADLKVFLTASLEERARRRLEDRAVPRSGPAGLRDEMQRIEARDDRDRNRPLSPLRAPPGALVIDTTGLKFEEQVESIVRHVLDLTGC
ncbi:MAG: 3-phosphoshikimate 1-carboxyvinyltransferase [Gemmatimonadetes bacterium]|nr:3-phosphoshikimate 1-carboxyvinyltransferase [Gemmatimonadota bacterium]